MSNEMRGVLRNAEGEHMMTLTADEIEAYRFLAEQGKVKRFMKIKKGRPTMIFQLKPLPPPIPEPSKSLDTACSLTPSDMNGLASMAFSETRITRFQLERWAGYGLLSAGAA